MSDRYSTARLGSTDFEFTFELFCLPANVPIVFPFSMISDSLFVPTWGSS